MTLPLQWPGSRYQRDASKGAPEGPITLIALKCFPARGLLGAVPVVAVVSAHTLPTSVIEHSSASRASTSFPPARPTSPFPSPSPPPQRRKFPF